MLAGAGSWGAARNFTTEYHRIPPALYGNYVPAHWRASALTNTLTPEVGRIHFDDILNQFQVCASFQLKTPAGNFPHKEVCVSAATLTEALQEIVSIWAGGSLPTDGKLAYVVGDNIGLAAAISAANDLDYAAPVFPDPPEINSTSDDGIDIYEGDYGVTMPP